MNPNVKIYATSNKLTVPELIAGYDSNAVPRVGDEIDHNCNLGKVYQVIWSFGESDRQPYVCVYCAFGDD